MNPANRPESGWIVSWDAKAAAHNYRWAELNRPDAKPLTIHASRCYDKFISPWGRESYVQFAVCFGVGVSEVKDGHWREVRKTQPHRIIPMTIERLEALERAPTNGAHWLDPSETPHKRDV